MDLNERDFQSLFKQREEYGKEAGCTRRVRTGEVASARSDAMFSFSDNEIE